MDRLNQTAKREEFVTATGEVTLVEEVAVWAVEKQEDQPDSGIYIGLNDASGVTVTEETLAVLGYVRG